jgi:hypothetical protein
MSAVPQYESLRSFALALTGPGKPSCVQTGEVGLVGGPAVKRKIITAKL